MPLGPDRDRMRRSFSGLRLCRSDLAGSAHVGLELGLVGIASRRVDLGALAEIHKAQRAPRPCRRGIRSSPVDRLGVVHEERAGIARKSHGIGLVASGAEIGNALRKSKDFRSAMWSV